MNAIERELLFKDEVYAIVGAAMEVSNVLGSGFLEAVYQEALQIELSARKIPFVVQSAINISYKGRILRATYSFNLEPVSAGAQMSDICLDRLLLAFIRVHARLLADCALRYSRYQATMPGMPSS